MSFAAVSAAVVGVTGIAVGAVNGAKAEKGIKNAMSKRRAYKTPDEVFQILNATENKSQGDTITRDFQMNQLDTSFADILGTAETLGADPNQLSSLFGQKLQGMLQVGDQFHKSNTESFGNYINALKLVGDNKAAEQISQDNIWKDYMQSLAKKKADANTTVNNGINSLLSGIGIYGTNQLYKEEKTPGINSNNFIEAPEHG
jgi:hypothetical protein